MTDMTNVEFIRDLAARMFRSATPAMGFDQGDTDRLYVIANRLAALEQAGQPEQPLTTLQRLGQEFDGEGEACKPDRIKARADAIAHLTVPEDGNYKGNREYKQHFRIARDAALAAFEDIAALSEAREAE